MNWWALTLLDMWWSLHLFVCILFVCYHNPLLAFIWRNFLHILLLTHSSSDTFFYWHFLLLTHSSTDTFLYWHSLLVTHSSSDTFFYWHIILLTHSSTDKFFIIHSPIVETQKSNKLHSGCRITKPHSPGTCSGLSRSLQADQLWNVDSSVSLRCAVCKHLFSSLFSSFRNEVPFIVAPKYCADLKADLW
jgi:hypothetical protein